MAHLDEFNIEQFRGIQHLTLGELGQINLLVGDNNSGKTSVLEALSIYADPLNWRKWYDAASGRDVSAGLSSITRMPRLSLVERWAWLFPQQADDASEVAPEKSEIVLQSTGRMLLKSVWASYEKFLTIEQVRQVKPGLLDNGDIEVENIKITVKATALTPQGTLFGTAGDETLTVEWIFSEQSSPRVEKRTSFLPAQLIHPFSHRLSSLQPRLWTSVVEAELKAPTLELLQSYDPGIQDVDLITPGERQLVLSIKHQKLGRAPLSTFGDGLRRIFTLATAIPQCRNGFLLIDELETAIHTRALRKTFEWLVHACIQNNVQLFATTHSIETIDAIIDASKSDAVNLVAYRLEQKDEQTGATRLDKGLLTRLREDLGTEIR